jgi:predicted 3-demethylubiquinone-9 3-methyltransferase (glyoxalase superfamily)
VTRRRDGNVIARFAFAYEAAGRRKRRQIMINKIHPHLWYANKAEEAARFYASIFPNSHIDSVTSMPAGSPSGPEGSVVVIEFTLFDQPFMAMQAGPLDPFNHAISFMIECDDQSEIDTYWDALLANGGVTEQCGWIKDRYGVLWQIVPRRLQEMMKDKDRNKARRATQAMLKMNKLDLGALERAYAG